MNTIATAAATEWFDLQTRGDGGAKTPLTGALTAVAYSGALCEGRPLADWLLARMAADRPPQARKAAAAGLAQIHDAVPDPGALVPALITALRDPSKEIAATSAWMLSRVAGAVDDVPGVAMLLLAAARPTAQESYLPRHLRSAPGSDAARQKHLDDLRGNAPADFARGALLASIAKVGEPARSDRLAAGVRGLCADRCWLVGSLACEAMVALGEGGAVLGEAMAAARSADRVKRAEGIELLHRLAYEPSAASDAAQALTDALGDVDLILALATVEALAEVAEGGAVGAGARGALRGLAARGGLLGPYAALALTDLPAATREVPRTTDAVMRVLGDAVLKSALEDDVEPGPYQPAAMASGSSAPATGRLQPARGPVPVAAVLVRDLRPVDRSELGAGLRMSRNAELHEMAREALAAGDTGRTADVVYRDDGIAVLFHDGAASAAGFAVELGKLNRAGRRVPVVIALNVGTVAVGRDDQGDWTVRGEALREARIVTDHGEDGHILATRAFVADLPTAAALLRRFRDLGERRYSDFLHLYNLVDDLGGYGNPATPDPLTVGSAITRGGLKRSRWALAMLVLVLGGGLAGYRCRDSIRRFASGQGVAQASAAPKPSPHAPKPAKHPRRPRRHR